MNNFAVTRPTLLSIDLQKVDNRILRFINGWKVVEQYKGNTVTIPDYVPFNHFAVYNHPQPAEREEQLAIWCGWAGRSDGKTIDGLYDGEVIITLAIGPDQMDDPKNLYVNAE